MLCPLCNSRELTAKTILNQGNNNLKKEQGIFECRKCGLIFADDYLASREHLYTENYAAWGADILQEEQAISLSKKEAFRCQLKILLKYIRPAGKKFLDVGTGNGYMMEVAKEAGFEVWGTEISSAAIAIAEKKFPGKIFEGRLENTVYIDDFFDVISLTDVLEHLPNPRETIREVERILKPDGYLFLISPDTDSIWRTLLGKKWFQYKYDHVCYFNRTSLKYLLKDSGFELIEFRNNVKKFSLAYYDAYFQKYSFLGIGNFFRFVFPLLPKLIQSWSFSNPVSGEFLAVARKKSNL